MNAIYIVTSSFKLLPKQKKPNVSNEKKNQEAFTFTNSLQCCCALKKDCKHQSQGSTATVYCYCVLLFMEN